MNRFILLASFLFTLFSCSDDLQFNEHAFQVSKDNDYWNATEFSAVSNEDGSLRIVGLLKGQSITLNISGTEPGTYQLGIDSASTAVFTNDNTTAYSTQNNGNGEIIIESYDAAEQTYTGTFRFNAFSSDREVTNFTKGIFYRVPLVTVLEIENEGQLRASVDESELEANEVATLNENGMIEVQGLDADGSYIKLYIPETTPVGSYNLNEQSDSGTYAIYGYANGTTSTAQFGTLFLNEHDLLSGLIKGSFTFTTLLPNSVSVENGSFTAYY